MLCPRAAMESCAGGIVHKGTWAGGEGGQPLFSVREWMGWRAEGHQSWVEKGGLQGEARCARNLLHCQGDVVAFFEDLLGPQDLGHKRESRGSHRETAGCGGWLSWSAWTLWDWAWSGRAGSRPALSRL